MGRQRRAGRRVDRACREGVAEANRIIGDSLKGNEGHLRYRYIDALKTTPDQAIYLPAEAGLPILEVQRKALPAQ